MSDEIVQEVIDRLDRLGELGGQGFEILYRQAIYFGIVQILIGALLIAVIYGCWRGIRNFGYFGGEHIWSTQPHQMPDMGATLLGCLGGVTALASVILFANGVLRLLNPEYYAIREILGSVTG